MKRATDETVKGFRYVDVEYDYLREPIPDEPLDTLPDAAPAPETFPVEDALLEDELLNGYFSHG